MAHYPDLSPCTYFGRPEFDEDLTPPVTAIGWLDREHRYTKGDPGRHVFERLQVFDGMQWIPITHFGSHDCELCRYMPYRSRKDWFIPAAGGVTYAVPSGIIHYVACHDYCPPKQFCDDLLNCPLPDSPDYFAALRANGWPEWLARPFSGECNRQEALREAVERLGQAKCAAIDAFRAANGHYPDGLDEAEAPLQSAMWRYSRRDDGGFRLSGELAQETYRYVFDGESRCAWPQAPS